jgi:hypothetical protein
LKDFSGKVGEYEAGVMFIDGRAFYVPVRAQYPGGG